MKKFLLIAGLLAVVATPAFAQTYDPHFGVGHRVHSPFNSPYWGAHHHSRSAARARGYEAYGMAPGDYIGSNSPAATGGGSTGYNEMEKEEILNH